MLLELLASYLIGQSMGKKSEKKKHNDSAVNTAAIEEKKDDTPVARNIYNYNNLDESNTGNTLFNSQKKTRRTLFGTESV